MSEWTIDTLKEHIEKLLQAKDDGIRAALQERDKALKVQADETERRLNLLNGEHARIEAAAESFVSYGALYTAFSALGTIVMAAIALAAIYFRN